ncbi:MAG: phosphatidate cytidylyltransferase [Clostridia bacterium]|nr:phosphatidate cytidylyltransferase [Clostridia bacterium]
MNLKRILTTVIGLPIVVALLIVGNEYIIDVIMTLVAIVCMYEYFTVIEKVSHPIKWIGYLSTPIIAMVAFLPTELIIKIILFAIPILFLLLFLKVIITNMESTFKDVAYTFLGIIYVTFFMTFLSLIRGLENGGILLLYVFLTAWSTDIFAYIIGKNFGKHFFSKISPKKTIEGSIAGIVGAVIVGLIYMILANKFGGLNINSYVLIGCITALLSVISQIGDFIASCIKRFVDIKDYGDLIPGHGGMLDRIDSLIFIAPFAYMFFTLII